jgi:hypothetical protein
MMAIPNGVRALVAAIALIALAVPAPQVAVPSAYAQTGSAGYFQASYNLTGGTCAGTTTPDLSASCYVEATPGLRFLALPGATQLVTFTCGAGIGYQPGLMPSPRAPAASDLSGGQANANASIVPGCYDLNATISDLAGSGHPTITLGLCGNDAATLSGSTISCASHASPLCAVGANSLPTLAISDYCAHSDVNSPRGAQMFLPFAADALHAYLLTVTGYTDLLASCVAASGSGGGGTPATIPVNTNGTRGTCYTNAAGTATGPACPTGFTFYPGPFTLVVSLFVPPLEAPVLAPDGACSFIVFSRHYVPAVTKDSGGAGAGAVPVRFGVNCSAEPPPGTPALGFPSGSTYNCVARTLFVEHIPLALGPASPALLSLRAGETGACTAGTSLRLVAFGHANGAGAGTLTFVDSRQAGQSTKLSATTFSYVLPAGSSTYLEGTGMLTHTSGAVTQRAAVPFVLQIVREGSSPCSGQARVQAITGYDSGPLSIGQP